MVLQKKVGVAARIDGKTDINLCPNQASSAAPWKKQGNHFELVFFLKGGSSRMRERRYGKSKPKIVRMTAVGAWC